MLAQCFSLVDLNQPIHGYFDVKWQLLDNSKFYCKKSLSIEEALCWCNVRCMPIYNKVHITRATISNKSEAEKKKET